MNWSLAMTEFDFFFQAEDGIRDTSVTGVQTCALPIYANLRGKLKDHPLPAGPVGFERGQHLAAEQEFLDVPDAEERRPRSRAEVPFFVIVRMHKVSAGKNPAKRQLRHQGGRV